MADTTTTSSSDDADQGPIRVSVQHDPERFPYALARGGEANVSALRANTSDAQTRAAFFEERNTNTVALEAEAPALLLEHPLLVEVTMRSTGGETEIFGNDDDDNDEEETGKEDENDENGEPSSSLEPERRVPGQVFVTNTQVLFVATEAEDSESDLAIGGACVVLHAMTEDPEPSVYLQLSSEDDVDTGGVTEVTLIPSGGETGDSACQALFDALCKLISLHPIEGDDDEEDGGMFGFGGGGGMIGGGFGDDVYADYGEPADMDGDMDGDGLVWAPPAAATGGEATPAERQAMLDRLDDMLVVAPGLQVDDQGQFDDAPES